MAFIGETTDVSIAELLSVLARRGHTGRLTISADGDDTLIYLDAGRISLVSSTRRDVRLGRILVRLGAIEEDNLDSAVREQDQDGRRRALGQILVESGRISAADLEKAAEEQCIESLAQVIVASHGAFVFHRELRPAITNGLLALNTEGIVLEASRRADEMARLRGMLPPPGARLGLTPKANAHTASLGVAETLVVDALRRSPCTLPKLGEILAVEEAALWRAIVRLRERGMIYAVDDQPDVEIAPPPSSSQGRTMSALLQLCAAGPTPSTPPLPTLDQIRAGEPAPAETASAITALVHQTVADRNGQRAFKAWTAYTDDFFRRRGMMTAAEIEALRHDGPELALEAQERVTAVRDIRALSDRRASAIVVSRLPGAPENRKIMIFTPLGQAWRIDADLG